MQNTFGLYFHIPICTAICDYCDFTVFRLKSIGDNSRRALVPTLLRELEIAVRECPDLQNKPLGSIYFGGGTPSLLEPDEINRMIEASRNTFDCNTDTEITLECNPMDAETKKLEGFQTAGVNRISLGVQSFQRPVLRVLGRPNRPEGAAPAIERIQQLGFPDWSMDLIFSAPGTVQKDFENDLQQAIRFRPPHVSIYGLTLHSGTPMFEGHKQGRIALPPDDIQSQMFLSARTLLQDAGYEHYEISNYAQPGHQSRHNSLYWTGGEYLGLGVGAHSYFDKVRRANPVQLQDYTKQINNGIWPSIAESPPTKSAYRGETIMLALRRCAGFDPAKISAKIECDFLKVYKTALQENKRDGFLNVSENKVCLTEQGLLMSDTVFESFF